MAATNCGSILSKCSCTMRIRFCMWLWIGANVKPRILHELTWPLKRGVSPLGLSPTIWLNMWCILSSPARQIPDDLSHLKHQ